MSHGADKARESGGIPYEPFEVERPRLATSLRWFIVTRRLGDLEHIVRFRKGGRFTVPLPSGEELLRYATFEERGKIGMYLVLRASVSIPCPPDEPYQDAVEFMFLPEMRDAPESPGRTPDAAPVARITNNVRYQALAVLAVGAVLLVGEMTSGMVSSAWKKAQSVMDRIEGTDEKTRRDPPSSPPIQLPEPWIRY